MTVYRGRLQEGVDFCVETHERVEENEAFVRGENQWEKSDIDALEETSRPALTWNQVVHSVGAISGREVLGRYRPHLRARTEEADYFAKNFDAILEFYRTEAGSDHEESLAFRSNITSGIAVVQTYWDELAEDGEGSIRKRNRPVWDAVWDPYATQQNLKDRTWAALGFWTPFDEVRARLEGLSEEADEFIADVLNGRVEEKYTTGGRYPWETVRDGRFLNKDTLEVFVVEYEYSDLAARFVVAAPLDERDLEGLFYDHSVRIEISEGQFISAQDFPEGVIDPQVMEQLLRGGQLLTFEDYESFSEYRKQRNAEENPVADTDWVKVMRRVTRYAIIVGDYLLMHGERLWGRTINFQTGLPNPKRGHTEFYGLVDIAKDPQRWLNKFLSAGLAQLSLSPRAPFAAEVDAFHDLDETLDTMSNPHHPILLKPGAAGKIHSFPPPQFPDFSQWMSLAGTMLDQAFGLSAFETGGQTDLRRISSKVVDSVTSQSNATLSIFFDSLRSFRKADARLVLKMVQALVPERTLRRIVGNRAAPAGDLRALPPKSEWPDIRAYDLVVDEEPVGEDSRLKLWEGMTNTAAMQQWVAEGKIGAEMVVRFMPGLSGTEREEFIAELRERDQILQLLKAMSQDPEGQQVLQRLQGGQQPGGTENG